MDSLSDSEIEAIWERLKDYIDPSELQEGTIDEIATQLRYRLEALPAPSFKRQKQTLISHDFAERAIQVPEIVAELPIKGRVLLGEEGVEKPTPDSPFELVFEEERPRYKLKEGATLKLDDTEFGSGDIIPAQYMDKARPYANPTAKTTIKTEKPSPLQRMLKTTLGTLQRVSIKGRDRFQAGEKITFEGKEYRKGWFMPKRAYEKEVKK